MKKLLVFFFFLSLRCLSAQPPSVFIHLDQFGYQTAAEKVAVLSDPQVGFNSHLSYTPGATLEIRNSSTNQVVWTGSPQVWNGGQTHDLSGDRGWWLDFSSLTQPGHYYIVDVANNEQSATFTIGDQVYASVLADAGRAFFYNRCNFPKAAPFAETGWVDGANNFVHPLQDTECSYVYDPGNAALRRDLSGGWFDAGDYNKYVTFAQSAVHDLLWAYSESPAVFPDNWNIPESGNGIPDILDEVKWEIDWLRKMMNPDGSVIIKMGSISHSDNSTGPPSVNTHRRYYGPTCTSASIAAASMLAHAASVFQQFPAWSVYASEIGDEAAMAFAYWLAARNNNALEYDCDDGTIKSGDADRNDQRQKDIALTAAIHLFDLTGQSQYDTYIVNHLSEVSYMQSNYWGVNNIALASALLRYTSMSAANSSARTSIINSMTPMVTQDWNGFYGFNPDDLYRAFMPEWSYHWSSNSVVNQYANLNRIMANYGIAGASADDFRRKAAGMLHYIHGVNPLGIVYLSGMEGRGAERGIQEIYHTWFGHGSIWDNKTVGPGPAPGFLSGGPNKFFSVPSISPPSGQPSMKSYKDWNTSWPESSWEITEPGIYYQAAYIRNLAAQMNTGVALPVHYAESFRVSLQQPYVLLAWTTALEQQSSYFGVERSADGRIFETIARVAAAGNSSRPRDYRSTDSDPLPGLNYYRLKQVDIDGTFTYSEVRAVYFRPEEGALQLSAYPNPVHSADALVAEIGLTRSEPLTLALYDQAGRMVYTTRLEPSGNHVRAEIPVAGLAPGIYLLSAQNQQHLRVSRVVVNP